MTTVRYKTVVKLEIESETLDSDPSALFTMPLLDPDWQ